MNLVIVWLPWLSNINSLFFSGSWGAVAGRNSFISHSKATSSFVQPCSVAVCCQDLKPSRSFGNHCAWTDFPLKITNGGKANNLGKNGLQLHVGKLLADARMPPGPERKKGGRRPENAASSSGQAQGQLAMEQMVKSTVPKPASFRRSYVRLLAASTHGRAKPEHADIWHNCSGGPSSAYY